MHADRFCRRVNRLLGDQFTVRWEKRSTDEYDVVVIANITGQVFKFGMLYDDFRCINPDVVASRAFLKLEGDMRHVVNNIARHKSDWANASEEQILRKRADHQLSRRR